MVLIQEHRNPSATVHAAGQSQRVWWATTINDSQLKELLSVVYKGPDAILLRDESDLGGGVFDSNLCRWHHCRILGQRHWWCTAGKSVAEQLHTTRQHLIGKLSDITFKNYLVGLR